MYVLAVGNAFDGIHIIGPFADMESAFKYADENRLSEWHCLAMHSVN